MSRKTPEGMTIMVVSETKNMTAAPRREAIDRAWEWAWYAALHAKDRDTRAHWRAVEYQLTGVTIALAMASDDVGGREGQPDQASTSPDGRATVKVLLTVGSDA